MSAILSEVYTSASTGRVLLDTLEIYSTAWADPVVLVRDHVPHEITTEDARVLVAQPCGMAVALPKRDGTGAQNLTFAIDGVRPEATRLLRASIDAGARIDLTYRVYLDNDLSEPAEPPYHLIVRQFRASASRVDVTAGLFDLIDMRWPRMTYNSATTPGLKYV